MRFYSRPLPKALLDLFEIQNFDPKIRLAYVSRQPLGLSVDNAVDKNVTMFLTHKLLYNAFERTVFLLRNKDNTDIGISSHALFYFKRLKNNFNLYSSHYCYAIILQAGLLCTRLSFYIRGPGKTFIAYKNENTECDFLKILSCSRSN